MEEAHVGAVVVSSPLSRFPLLRWLFRREVARLARAGIPVYCFEPDRSVIGAMGFNPMKVDRAPLVAKASYDRWRQLLTVDRRLSNFCGPI
jgi:hypothetical protein